MFSWSMDGVERNKKPSQSSRKALQGFLPRVFCVNNVKYVRRLPDQVLWLCEKCQIFQQILL